MGAFFSGVDKIRILNDEDAYRSYLISRSQPPIVVHSGEMHLKRLRVLARRVGGRVSAALNMVHKAILAAKVHRVRRELMFHASSHDEWSRFGTRWPEEHDLEKDIRDFPQRPLILSDKWDS
jgi:hypothetical protein